MVQRSSAVPHCCPLAGLLLAPLPVWSMDLSYAPSSVKEGMEARDEAADYKCKAMFDCECY